MYFSISYRVWGGVGWRLKVRNLLCFSGRGGGGTSDTRPRDPAKLFRLSCVESRPFVFRSRVAGPVSGATKTNRH